MNEEELRVLFIALKAWANLTSNDRERQVINDLMEKIFEPNFEKFIAKLN